MLKYFFQTFILIALILNAYSVAISSEFPKVLDIEERFVEYRKLKKEDRGIQLGKVSLDDACMDFYSYVCTENSKDDSQKYFLGKPPSKTTVEEVKKSLVKIYNQRIEFYQTKNRFITEFQIINQTLSHYVESEGFLEILEEWNLVLDEVKYDIYDNWPDKNKGRLISELVDIKIDMSAYENISAATGADTIFGFGITAHNGSNENLLMSIERHDIVLDGFALKNFKNKSVRYFILAHEVAHHLLERIGSIKEGALIRDNIINNFNINLDNPLEHKKFLELEADKWAAIMLDFNLKKKNADRGSYLNEVKNALQPLCGYPGSKKGHPTGIFRIEFAMGTKGVRQMACFGNSPDIQKKSEEKYSQYLVD